MRVCIATSHTHSLVFSVKEKRRRKRGVDYNAEIPFEKKPAPGFYDTANEKFDADAPNFKRLRQQNLDGERRDDKEAVRTKTGSNVKKKKTGSFRLAKLQSQATIPCSLHL